MSFFSWPLQFGALLKLYRDPNLKLGKAAHRQSQDAAAGRGQEVIPASTELCLLGAE